MLSSIETQRLSDHNIPDILAGGVSIHVVPQLDRGNIVERELEAAQRKKS